MTAPGLCPQVVTITGGSTAGISAALAAPAKKRAAERNTTPKSKKLFGFIVLSFICFPPQ
jgi:hypothetical protein